MTDIEEAKAVVRQAEQLEAVQQMRELATHINSITNEPYPEDARFAITIGQMRLVLDRLDALSANEGRVRAMALEEAAKVAEADQHLGWYPGNMPGNRIATAIRARIEASPSPAPGDPVEQIVAWGRLNVPSIKYSGLEDYQAGYLEAFNAIERGDWKAPAPSDKGDDRS